MVTEDLILAALQEHLTEALRSFGIVCRKSNVGFTPALALSAGLSTAALYLTIDGDKLKVICSNDIHTYPRQAKCGRRAPHAGGNGLVLREFYLPDPTCDFRELQESIVDFFTLVESGT